MKLDIRTTREIMEYNCGSVEALSLFEKKVWVSQESLMIELNDMIKNYESLRGQVEDDELDEKLETVREIIRRVEK